jgi:type IV fimbrial biogenesis protein FimT
LELIVTIAVAGVLFAVAIPNLRTFSQNNRLTGASNDLLRSFQLARSEAITRQQTVVVCASANPTANNPACSYGTFANGWIVFQDTNGNWAADGGEPILERHVALDTTLTVKADANYIESYGLTGFANPGGAKNPTRNIVLCDLRGIQALAGTNSTARALFITTTGRARISNLNADVNTAAGAIGTTCP